MSSTESPRSGLRRIVRWVPATLLALMQAVAWGAVLVGGLTGVVGWVALLSVIPFAGTSALLLVAVAAVWKRRVSAPMGAAALLTLPALWTGAWSFGMAQIEYPASLASTRPSATVRLPSNEPLTVAFGGDRLATNYHAFTPDQRWAYDLIIGPYLTGSSKLDDYGCWGTEVVAPADARVHAAHDGEPDAEPGKPSNNSLKPLGNFVALELSTKTFLIIAHLQPGSVSVKPGELVTECQRLGRCGNSGNTSEPHIHLHHQRQDPEVFPVGFAEGLPLFFRDHDGPPMPEGGVEARDGRPVVRGAVVRHLGTPGGGTASRLGPEQ